ncbi:MAG: tRNA (adenosine(37)-N6)-threonylcarbamoyltransferase complex transferase subunit TsaD, partial [Alphaproteobacteria bacterium]|nr:tRNA (adenosine(37)-N6)-threonylcarbamoyltransferase complex transferase subunit TsaD [Alphaproteobacteria bacterium]
MTTTCCTLLALESSCDETAVALLRQDASGTRVLAENLHSQIAQHAEYGGVVPEIAARAHLHYFPDLIRQTLSEGGILMDNLTAIACTTGPGLIGGLLVGSMMARAIARREGLPFYGIHHLEGHLLSPRLGTLPRSKPEFPYLVLLASGGHTLIVLAEGLGQYCILGRSRDDALGEAFDKSAIIMGLPYPGGPVLERYAVKGEPDRFSLPSPLIGSREKADRMSCDFSFSGLKTAVARLWQKLPQMSETARYQTQCDIAAGFHRVVSKILCNRLENALQRFRVRYPNHGTHAIPVVFVGGVSANQILRNALEGLCQQKSAQLSTVPHALCTDNAVMIACAAFERIQANLSPEPNHNPARPR